MPPANVDRAVVESTGPGFLRLVATSNAKSVLEATLAPPHAGDIVGELCPATTHGLGLGLFSSTLHPRPQHGEIVRKAGDLWM